MLLTLSVENFLTIQTLELDFQPGLTVLTGETGAGKSILIEALKIALGEKAEASCIRVGQETAEIIAHFDISPDSAVFQWMIEQNLAHETELVLRRVLQRTGRGKAYINGKLCPLSLLVNCGKQLLHVHGQHAHQQLLQTRTARSQLDRYAQHDALVHQVEQVFQSYQSLKRQMLERASTEETQQRLDFLKFQQEELLQGAVEPDEIESLYVEQKRLHHVKAYEEVGAQLLQLFKEDRGIQSQFSHATQLLRHLPGEAAPLRAVHALVESAMIQCEEIVAELSVWAETLVADPERLEIVEARMGLLHQLARKYRVDVAELPLKLAQLTEECETLARQIEVLPALEASIQKAYQQYEVLARELSASRQQHARKLSAAITGTMASLGMPQGEVRLQVSEKLPGDKEGIDAVEYEVTTHPSMPFQLLSKVVSGGELSRISLAIELMTNERTGTPVLVFDEVDVGIGGKTAAMVGRLLRQLGERVQVFSVTHQAQVAAFAHQHLRVEKCADAISTSTAVKFLSMAERSEELARMLGGVSGTGHEAHQHAERLLAEATSE